MANYELALTASEIDVALQKAHSPTTSITNSATSDPSLVTSGAVKAAIDNISVGSTLTVNSFATAALETSTDTLTDTDTAIPTSAAVKDYVDTASALKSASFKRTAEFIVQNESYQTIPITAEGDPILSVANNIATIPAGTYLMWHSFQYKGPGDISTATYGMDLNINVTSGMSGFSGLGLWESGAPTSSYRTAVRLNGAIKTVTQPTSFRLQMRDDPSQNTYQQYIRNLSWTFLKLY